MKTVLAVAGSDCSGGAGLQADSKTITAHKLYAMSVPTALTGQNTQGVFGVQAVPAAFVAQQLDCIFTDIFPDAVKVGMLTNAEIVQAVADKLRQYAAKNIVVDPVMVSTSGRELLTQDARAVLAEKLLPLAALVTPNLPEAEAFCGFPVQTAADMERAAQSMGKRFGCAVLLKGGHLTGGADDLLWQAGTLHWFRGERVKSRSTHGTGCTLSSAIACGLAAGQPLAESVRAAKDYLTGAMRAGLNLGHGHAPLNHVYKL